MKINIQDFRENYTKGTLDISDVAQNPFEQFHLWFEQAVKAELKEPNAFNLATISLEGKPHSRIMLLKNLDSHGFTFFTNYESNKGKSMEKYPFIAMNFFWNELERQVRIEGKVEKVTEKESLDYFNVRPRGSQIGAWVSNQSQEIESKEFLLEKEQFYIKKFEGMDVPKPDHWGGYRLIPEYVEFWQGRPSRLHDRIFYRKMKDNSWKIGRLSP